MIKALIFDYFDVFRADGYNRWLKDHGYERTGPFLEASERHDRGEFSDQEFFQAIAEASGETAAQVEREMEADIELNTELVQYVEELGTSYKIALLSNSSSDYLRNELAMHELEKHFHEIVISSEVKLIKPEPEIFKHIMKKLSVNPQECIFIDDNPRNVAAARTLGIHGIVFANLQQLKKELIEHLG
ncbi:HAD family phosphatase [Candidatus Saccharibacteria bacterium]|nr:HAD family phosphatase [Candidatus Saccharibacteria bacterium]